MAASPNHDEIWLEAVKESVEGYRKMIDRAVAQLTDEEFARRPTPEFNSVATLLRHLGGNLRSRWTNFLREDGEKPDRNREAEFEDWPGDRHSLLTYFDEGWQELVAAIDSLRPEDLSTTIYVRGEPHTIPQAILRSITHLSYHVGQIMLVARLVHEGTWNWLTIAPGGSTAHNQLTWGTTASRGVAGEK